MDEYRKYEPIFGSWYLSRQIGKGSFGKVYEITREEYGTTYRSALKIISIPQDEDDVKTRLASGTEMESVTEYYKGIRTHKKMFEIRKDDDGIKPGDILVLREWDGEKYTGGRTRREVTAVLRDCPEYGLMPGYVILSLQVPGWDYLHPQAVLDETEGR